MRTGKYPIETTAFAEKRPVRSLPKQARSGRIHSIAKPEIKPKLGKSEPHIGAEFSSELLIPPPRSAQRPKNFDVRNKKLAITPSDDTRSACQRWALKNRKPANNSEICKNHATTKFVRVTGCALDKSPSADQRLLKTHV